ncbi:ABC transporter ATP-binding protein [Anaerotruncus sp. AF02-27]|uniref:ABC transporter ATP-binding protein n=1 Tax=Anaerotruncus TaxID=244127 RepID=UPI000E4C73D1|nr:MULTISPECIES: ABC transporter ATP-binding protein [Anaerotruncus]RGX54388.1 ABC transporter ATP-binding protein [Anaerotruncus sp. AF02-27]
MRKILSYFSPYKKPIVIAVAFMLLDVVCEVIQPTLMSNIVGKGIQSGNIPYILGTGAIMILTALIAIVAGFGNARNSAIAGVGFAANLRRGLFEKVQQFSFKNIDDFSTASLATRLTNDVTLMQNSAIMGLRLMIRAPLMFIFAMIMAVRMNAELAVILCIIIPAVVLSLAFIIRKAMPLFDKMQGRVDALNGSVQENLTNVRVVKSFVRQDYEKEKFETANNRLMEASLRAMNVVIFNMPVLMFIMNMSAVSVIWFGGGQVIEGSLNVAEMTAFINYIFQILMSLMMLSMMFILFSRASASFKRAREVLETEIDLTDSENAERAPKIRGDVEFDHVSFKYAAEHEEYILKDISFTAKAGEVIAIIGGTGAGKSSLVQLIPRLYDATEGAVRIDGKDVRGYTVESLRSQIGVVLQKNTLFSGTIAQNLRWGNPHATDEEIVEAAKAAQAHDFIESFPNGYDTWIEQGGVNVSGGQKQRLCIARAMLKKPPILILDDSTSAVDTATEQRIRQAFDTTLKDTTTFIIAQRISSVKDADKIIILSDGKVSAIGTHDELLKNNEEYQEIYYSQQEKEATA